MNSTPRLHWRRKASDEAGPLVTRCAGRFEGRGSLHCAGEILKRREKLRRRSGRPAKSLAFMALAAKAEWTARSRNPLQVCPTSSLTRSRRLPGASASSFYTSCIRRAIGRQGAGRNLEAVGCAGVDAAAGSAPLTWSQPQLPFWTALRVIFRLA